MSNLISCINYIKTNHPELLSSIDFYNFVSGSPAVNIDFVLDNIEQNWNYTLLIMNSSINIVDILNTINDLPWNHNFIQYNPTITIAYVLNNPEYPWDYAKLSQNTNISWADVQANPNHDWDYLSIVARLS